MSFCTKCGTQLSEQARFCPVCGNLVSQQGQPQGYPQAPNQGYAQAPNQGYAQAPNQGYPQAPNQGYPQAPNQGYAQAPNQGYPQAPGQGYSQAQPQAPRGNQRGPIIRKFKAEGFTFVNYNMPIRDEYDRLLYEAKTVSESMINYTFRAWYPDGREAFTVKTKVAKLLTLFLEQRDAQGRLITSIDQQIHRATYDYVMPEAGLTARGDFVSFHFQVMRGARVAAEIDREFTVIKDSYVAKIYDPSAEIPVLGLMMAIQIQTIISKHR